MEFNSLLVKAHGLVVQLYNRAKEKKKELILCSSKLVNKTFKKLSTKK